MQDLAGGAGIIGSGTELVERHGMMKLAIFAVTAAATLGQAQSAPARRPLELNDLYRLRDVGDPRISPDGNWVAYTVTTVDSAKDRSDSDVWMVSWDGRRSLRLTNSPEGESNPQWSPDNRYLSFVSGRFESRGGQLWLLDRAGGEAVRVSDVKGGFGSHEWSPDGSRVVFVQKDPDPDESKPDSLRSRNPKPIVVDRYAFKRDITGYLDRRRDHIYVLDINSKKVEQITTGDFDDSSPRWSPDGRKIAFVSERNTADADRENNTDIYVVDAAPGATPMRLTDFPGPENSPVWSPDGSAIAFLRGSAPELYAYSQSQLAVVPSAGGPARLLAPSLDRDVSDPTWSRDGRSITFLLGDDRAVHLASIDVSTGRVTRLTNARHVVTGSDLSLQSGRMVLRLGDTKRSAEAFAWEEGTPRQLTHVNDSLFSVLQLAETEDITFRNGDGQTVGALLVKPAGFDPARRYPMLLRIHGGPNSQDQHAFSFERELFATAGYLVLAVNYRGSSGRGQDWKKAIYADWGNKEVQDLIAGVDHVISLGFVDPERLGIGGWSYGGILTNYTTATTTRFKAATSGAGSALMTAMYGVDQYIYQYETELGPPWKNPKLWEKVSYPFYNAHRIRTPTLYLGGEKDFNVPIAGSEQMYQALRSQGVDTQLIVYPGQFHGITRPSFQRDRYERYLAWYDRYLKPVVP